MQQSNSWICVRHYKVYAVYTFAKLKNEIVSVAKTTFVYIQVFLDKLPNN